MGICRRPRGFRLQCNPQPRPQSQLHRGSGAAAPPTPPRRAGPETAGTTEHVTDDIDKEPLNEKELTELCAECAAVAATSSSSHAASASWFFIHGSWFCEFSLALSSCGIIFCGIFCFQFFVHASCFSGFFITLGSVATYTCFRGFFITLGSVATCTCFMGFFIALGSAATSSFQSQGSRSFVWFVTGIPFVHSGRVMLSVIRVRRGDRRRAH